MENITFEYFESQIEEYEKLSFSQAKEMLKLVIDFDELTKKEMVNRVFEGTMHYVLRFIKTAKYEVLNSCTYDISDIINSAYYLWYEKVSNFEILKYSEVTLAMNNTFASDIARKLIPSKNEFDESVIANRDVFNELFLMYVELKDKKDDVSLSELINYYNDKKIFGFYYLKDEYDSVIKMYNIIKYSYDNLSISPDIRLNLRNIKNISRLLEEQGLFEELTSEYTDENNLEDEVINNIYADGIYKLIFEELYLHEREKKILKLRYGFYDGERHTLEDVASMYKLSRNRIGEIEKKALRKIKRRIQYRYRGEFYE